MAKMRQKPTQNIPVSAIYIMTLRKVNDNETEMNIFYFFIFFFSIWGTAPNAFCWIWPTINVSEKIWI